MSTFPGDRMMVQWLLRIVLVFVFAGMIMLQRNGQLVPAVAVAEPARSAAVNAPMQQMYTWRDTLIGTTVGGREVSTAIDLDPL
jgi:hypothetical protein